MQALLLYSRGETKSENSGKPSTQGHKASKTHVHHATLLFFQECHTTLSNVSLRKYDEGNDTNMKTFFSSLERKALFLNKRVLLIRIFIKVNEKQNELKTSREIFPDVNNKLLQF